MDIAPDLVKLGYQLIAVSADRPDLLQVPEGMGDETLVLFSDNEMKGAGALGIAWQMQDEQVVTYKEKYAIDVEADSGHSHHLLPVPTVILADTEGKVRFLHANPDHRSRMDPGLLLAVARSLSGTPSG